MKTTTCPKGHIYTHDQANSTPGAPSCPECAKEWARLTETLSPIKISISWKGDFPGCFNHSADEVPRINRAWSDSNLDTDYADPRMNSPQFHRLKCRNCGGIAFEVLSTDTYETSAKCCGCGMYYIVHSG